MARKNGGTKKWTTVTKEFAKLEGFWQCKEVGDQCIGVVREFVEAGEYPFYVLEATENVSCLDKEEGVIVAAPGESFGVSGSKVLDVLKTLKNREVKITYQGKKTSKRDREFRDYTVEVAEQDDSTIT
jgi:hypothetical protein